MLILVGQEPDLHYSWKVLASRKYRYLPGGKELRKTPKQWICNVLATIAGKPFVDWIKFRINERNAQVVKDRNLGIPMD